MERRFILILVLLAVVFGGFLAFNKKDSSDNGSNGSAQAQTSNHTYGEGKKNVTLAEYADFQCPACAAYFPIIKQVKEKYKEDITFQFINFPLDSIHQNARAAHRAAEAAAKQNKFWEMHDKLYENQQAWESVSDPKGIFEDYATQLSLNMDQFRADVASSETNGIINADISKGKDNGVSSTPTFFINGVKVESTPRDIESFYKLIDEAISKQSNSGQNQ